MPTTAQIEDAVTRYVDAVGRQDLEATLALFAEDARQEDPVGTPPNVGRDAIRAFYDNVRQLGPGTITVANEPIVIGNEAILAFGVTTDVGEQRVRVPFIVDHFTFDDAGLITSLRAF